MADDVRTLSRFVRPIYDAIDGRQYRAAIKLCGHKKVAHLDIVQVLKAHCLERTGRQDEALDIVRAVQRNRPTDETLLNTMYLVFRLCGCEDEMVPTYEHACSATTPPNEELFASLFAAYARRGEFLKQQQTALKMSKAFGKLKYMCWAAQSMMLQVQHGGAPPKMLALADKMLLKTMRDTRSDDGEALQLLVEILRRQDRHEDALQAFDEFAPIMQASAAAAKEPPAPHYHDGHACSHAHGPTATGRAAEGEGAFEEDIAPGPLQAIDRLTLEAELAAAVQQWERSAKVYETLLTSYNADDWTYLRAFIDARLKQNDAAFDELLAFLEALAAKESNALLRGPWLAMVHVHSERVRRDPLASAAEDALVRQMSAYVERFYSKTCCFSDLRQYLALVSDGAVVSSTTKTRVTQLFSDMAAEPLLRQDSGDVKAARNQLNRRLLALKALRFLGAYDAVAPSELEALVQTLVGEYEACSWLNLGAQGGQREVQHTDDLLLLAAHALLALAQRAGVGGARRATLLAETAALLEYGLAKSAYNFQMKLLLAQVYSLLAAGDAMLARHQELDVKHIQLDSLSFLVLDKLLQLGQLPAARRLCESIRRLHSGTASDTPEYITRAYRLGVFSKVRDMTSFLHERMRPSQTLAIARGELLQFELQDALAAGGGARLAEFAASERLQSAVAELEGMLARELSANQHREVIVQWDSAPLLRVGDAFGGDDEPLVNVDRSAAMATSRRWLSLQLVAPKLLRSLAVATDAAAVDASALAEEYAAHVAALGLTANGGDVTARVWQWSCDVVALAALQPHASDAAERECVTRLAALQAALPSIRDDLCALLAPPKLTARALAAATLLVRDAGLWSGLLLCALLRAWTKRRGQSKKEDASGSAGALRSLLKHVQELLAAVELHVQALELSAAETPRDVLATASEELAAAHQTALEHVQRSHRNAQTQLSELLRTATASIRLGTQK
ncbi:hypothetical protein ATCC90586_005680 [Pythium insidiosum]|nr:hypothetical protein ATCC90586_005680 [Pythium insidiosum]